MNKHTLLFHETLIRLLKGVTTAWEKWLAAEVAGRTEKVDPPKKRQV